MLDVSSPETRPALPPVASAFFSEPGAQLKGSAAEFYSAGWEFESLRARQMTAPQVKQNPRQPEPTGVYRVERRAGLEPASKAWKAQALPEN